MFNFLATSSKCLTAYLRLSFEWDEDIWTRIRALSLGTTGKEKLTTNNFKSDEMINIKVASIQESIKLVFQITNDDSLAVNWNEIRLSLYYKEKTNDIWNF